MPYASADHIAEWGRRGGAERLLPELLLRLIQATTADRRAVRIRTGEGIFMGGWDCISDVGRGNEYVPVGIAGWELGTECPPGSKAKGDYDGRKKEPKPLEPATSAYVSLAPCRWGNRQSFIDEGNADGLFREVRAYDADDLYNWLQLAPAVHLWLSKQLGVHPQGAITPEERWLEYSTLTTPSLTPDMLLGGREREALALRARLRTGASGVIHVVGMDESDALGFVLAACVGDDTASELLSRMVLVEEVHAWRELVWHQTPLTLLPMFPDRGIINAAASKGHLVVVSTGPPAVPVGETIMLRALASQRLRQQLEAAGLGPADAQAVVSGAVGSATDLRRALDVARTPDVPEWAQPSNARRTGQLALIGEWQADNSADREALAEITRRVYDDLTDEFVRWRLSPRPLLEKAGHNWAVRDRREVWMLTSSAIVEEDLERFRSLAVAVLTDIDPRYDLPEEEWWTAGARGLRPRHSERLREAIANGVAMLAAIEAPIADSAISTQDVGCLVIRDIFADADWRRWASLSSFLQVLAEACPDEFLTAADRGLAGDSPALAQLFADRGDPLMASTSPHSGLLFALECLARTPECLSRSTLALARLAELDPGGRLANRPISSLTKPLRLVAPQTSASWDQRMAVLDLLRERHNEIAWSVMQAILPVTGSILLESPAPKWRHWPVGQDS